MASTFSSSSSYFSLIFFILFSLLNISSISGSFSPSDSLLLPASGRAKSNGFEQWLAWNIRNHRHRVALRPELTVTHPAQNATWAALDWKLRYAEANKIKVTVSQDSTGDYKSIKEALDGVSLFNKRRVIISIRPGIYRLEEHQSLHNVLSGLCLVQSFYIRG